MKPFYRPARLLPFVFLLLTAFSARSQNVTLKLNLAKGEKYPYSFNYDIDQELPQGAVKMFVGTDINMTVVREEGADKIIEATYGRMVMKMDMPELSYDVDTDRPAPTMEEIAASPTKSMAKIFQAVKGQMFTMRVNAKGELTEVTGFDKLVDNIVDSATAWFHLPDAAKQGMRDGMAKQFNAKTITDMMQQSFNIFPDKPVKIGDSWVKNIDTKGNNPNKLTNTYTVKSINNNEITLSLQSQVDNLGASDEVKLKGTQQGTLIVEIRTGMIVRSEITQDLAGVSNGIDIKMISKGVTERKK
jgi:hypothetical protein